MSTVAGFLVGQHGQLSGLRVAVFVTGLVGIRLTDYTART